MIEIGIKNKGKKRSNNEDAFFSWASDFGPLPNLYVVADGMGGHKSGAYASSLAIQTLKDFLHEHRDVRLHEEEEVTQLFKRAIIHVNYTLFKESQSNPSCQGMGTTLTMATIFEEKIYIGHVGDSRLYVFDGDKIEQVTKDHSYVQEMLNKGTISNKEALDHPKKNIITRAVGTYDKIEVDTYIKSKKDLKYVLLCSDGLTTMVREKDIYKTVASQKTLEEKANKLIELANISGGYDNITVILVDLDKAVK